MMKKAHANRLVLASVISVWCFTYIANAQEPQCTNRHIFIASCDYDGQTNCGYDLGPNDGWERVLPNEKGPLKSDHRSEEGGYVFLKSTTKKAKTGFLETGVANQAEGMCLKFYYATIKGASKMELYLKQDGKMHVLQNLHLNSTSRKWEWLGLSCCLKKGPNRYVGFKSTVRGKRTVALDHVEWTTSTNTCDGNEGQCEFVPPSYWPAKPTPRAPPTTTTLSVPTTEVAVNTTLLPKQQLLLTTSLPELTKTEKAETIQETIPFYLPENFTSSPITVTSTAQSERDKTSTINTITAVPSTTPNELELVEDTQNATQTTPLYVVEEAVNSTLSSNSTTQSIQSGSESVNTTSTPTEYNSSDTINGTTESETNTTPMYNTSQNGTELIEDAQNATQTGPLYVDETALDSSSNSTTPSKQLDSERVVTTHTPTEEYNVSYIVNSTTESETEITTLSNTTSMYSTSQNETELIENTQNATQTTQPYVDETAVNSTVSANNTIQSIQSDSEKVVTTYTPPAHNSSYLIKSTPVSETNTTSMHNTSQNETELNKEETHNATETTQLYVDERAVNSTLDLNSTTKSDSEDIVTTNTPTDHNSSYTMNITKELETGITISLGNTTSGPELFGETQIATQTTPLFVDETAVNFTLSSNSTTQSGSESVNTTSTPTEYNSSDTINGTTESETNTTPMYNTSQNGTELIEDTQNATQTGPLYVDETALDSSSNSTTTSKQLDSERVVTTHTPTEEYKVSYTVNSTTESETEVTTLSNVTSMYNSTSQNETELIENTHNATQTTPQDVDQTAVDSTLSYSSTTQSDNEKNTKYAPTRNATHGHTTKQTTSAPETTVSTLTHESFTTTETQVQHFTTTSATEQPAQSTTDEKPPMLRTPQTKDTSLGRYQRIGLIAAGTVIGIVPIIMLAAAASICVRRQRGPKKSFSPYPHSENRTHGSLLDPGHSTSSSHSSWSDPDQTLSHPTRFSQEPTDENHHDINGLTLSWEYVRDEVRKREEETHPTDIMIRLTESGSPNQSSFQTLETTSLDTSVAVSTFIPNSSNLSYTNHYSEIMARTYGEIHFPNQAEAAADNSMPIFSENDSSPPSHSSSVFIPRPRLLFPKMARGEGKKRPSVSAINPLYGMK